MVEQRSDCTHDEQYACRSQPSTVSSCALSSMSSACASAKVVGAGRYVGAAVVGALGASVGSGRCVGAKSLGAAVGAGR